MRNTNVFLSDMHIGSNAETNWYQKVIHQPIIKSTLSYLIENGRNIEDVVILGDWFEQWNYIPSVKVPTIETIFERNSELFRRSPDKADFVTLMEAIGGNLRFVNGDHDMLAELREINRLFARQTEKRVLPGHGSDSEKPAVSNTYYIKGPIWAEHGHQHDLFHKPALNHENLCAPLPLGYFVSRLYCHFLEKKMSSMHRRDAACITGISNSEFSNLGLHFSELLDELVCSISKGETMDASNLLIDQLMQFNRSFHVEFNLSLEGFKEVDSLKISKFFPRLMTLKNFAESLFEAEVAYSGLGRFARKHFCENRSLKVAIMGHTHRSEVQIFGSGQQKAYVNAGCLSPSKPDMNSRENLPTFLIVKDLGEKGIEIGKKIVSNNEGFDIVDSSTYLIP